jgi:hypothetical protein
MSAKVALSASFTWTPPKSRTLPSLEASATLWLMRPNQALKAAESPGALASDRRDVTQISERALDNISGLRAGETLLEGFLNGRSSFRCLEVGNDRLDQLVGAGSSFASASAELLAKASLSMPHRRRLLMRAFWRSSKA